MTQNDVEVILAKELSDIPGWCTSEKAKRMYELARGAKLCVELGVFGGRGLVAMALSLRDQGFGRADGIDPFIASAALEGTNDPANDEWWAKLDYDSIARVAQKTLYELELVQYAHLVRMGSCEVSEFYGDGTVDVLHQDSNHSEEVSCEEVELWAPKIRTGGYWIFDDTNWPTTKKAQAMLTMLGFLELEDHVTWKVYRKP